MCLPRRVNANLAIETWKRSWATSVEMLSEIERSSRLATAPDNEWIA